MAGSRQLANFSASLKRQYGEERISNEPPPLIVSTGIPPLDWALRVGGWQLGRVYEVVGPKDSGKSLAAIMAMAQHQRMFPDRGVGYVNIENTFDESWATRTSGLECSKADIESGRWIPMNAESSELASNMARTVISSGLISCVVVDSVGAMESAKVLSIDAEKDTMGKNAGVITKMTKALSSLARQNRTTVILVNQPRANFSMFGGPVSAGPMAMQHATTAQIKMQGLGGEGDVRTQKYFGDDEKIGMRVRATVPRMKNGSPGRRADWFIMNRETEEFGPAGVDLADCVISLGIRLDIVEQGGGGYYTLPGGTRVRGRKAAGDVLREKPEVMTAVRAAMQFEAPTPILEVS